MKDLIQLEKERFEWSVKTFTEATALSSLLKLKSEIDEVEVYLNGNMDPDVVNWPESIEEYADCLMCLCDSFHRAGIPVEQVLLAFDKKTEKNKNRIWKKNPDNSYSHVKQ
jgi:NTP pyrophosphatase (non-canonical NTP hydrolase)